MENQAAYLHQLRHLAESKLQWVSSTEWNDSDFERLSQMIFTETTVRLSITTLKRIWGRVKYDSSPNLATLNALAQFLGFTDWRTFKLSTDIAQNQSPIPVKKHKRSYLPIWAGITLILIIAVLVISGKNHYKPKNTAAYRHVTFSAKKVTEGLPNSVVFDYNANAKAGDSITLQQSWDDRRTEALSPVGRQHTSIYYIPGYFDAKLLINGHVVKETPVYIKTDGWLGLINKLPKAIYLNSKAIHHTGTLGIMAEDLVKAGSSSVFNDQWTEFYNVREFGDLNGNDFRFDANVRNTSTLEQSSCRKIVIDIIGTENAVVVPLSVAGCTSGLNVYTSSEWLLGKDTDLSALGCDVTHFQHIGISVGHKQFKVLLNDKTILSRAITQSIGKIAGICVGFEGAGEIKDVQLGSNSSIYYEEHF